MNRMHTRSLTAWKVLRVIASTTALTALATLALLYAVGALTSRSRQAEVATRGAQVMPFDLDATTHIFQPHDDGGIQQVIADSPSDTAQIALIRAHLQAEAAKFRRGDFSDPTTIHGMDMPGVAQLRAGYARIAVTYTELPNGAQLRYTTSDPALVAALRDWFAAQTSDHGEHAAPPSQLLQPTPSGEDVSTSGGDQHSQHHRP